MNNYHWLHIDEYRAHFENRIGFVGNKKVKFDNDPTMPHYVPVDPKNKEHIEAKNRVALMQVGFWYGVELNAGEVESYWIKTDKLESSNRNLCLENEQLQAKYEAVVAELEAAQGEIDRLKSLNDNLAFTISTAKMVTNQVKAATIRVAMDAIGSRWSSDTGTLMINADLLNDYASQLERGEL